MTFSATTAADRVQAAIAICVSSAKKPKDRVISWRSLKLIYSGVPFISLSIVAIAISNHHPGGYDELA
jgi:hypothetical protein